jgi:hypothetical protein
VIDDPETPADKRTAALFWINATSEEKSKGGTPLCLESGVAIMEQTSGKPTQPIELSGPDGGPIQPKIGFDFGSFASMFAITQPSEAVLSEPSGEVSTPSSGPAESQNRVGGNGQPTTETLPDVGQSTSEIPTFAPIIGRTELT